MMNPNIGELGSDKNQETGFRDNKYAPDAQVGVLVVSHS